MSRLLTYLYEIVLVAAVPLHSRLALSSPISFIYWFCCYAVGPVPVNKQVKRPATKGIPMKQTTESGAFCDGAQRTGRNMCARRWSMPQPMEI